MFSLEMHLSNGELIILDLRLTLTFFPTGRRQSWRREGLSRTSFSPIPAFSQLNWLKNSSFNLVVLHHGTNCFLVELHIFKNFHLITLPPCIRFAVCCHLWGFMAEHWQCLPTLPHMPCYYHQPALRIYSSTSSVLFFSLSIHKNILIPWMGWWEWFPCS